METQHQKEKEKNHQIEPAKRFSSRAPFDPFFELERMSEGLFSPHFGSLFGGQRWFSQPEVQETNKGYAICADIPGIPKDAVHVEVNGNMLTIKAEQKEESETPKGGYRRKQRSFHQSFALPTNIDAEGIEATCENGTLEVWVPKTKTAQAKKVKVK